MRQIRAIIYTVLGGMVIYNYWQRGQFGLAAFVAVFTIAMIALTLSPIGRMKIRWDDAGITLSVFPKKPRLIHWDDLEGISLDHSGYHIKSSRGNFKIRKRLMPKSLRERIEASVQQNRT